MCAHTRGIRESSCRRRRGRTRLERRYRTDRARLPGSGRGRPGLHERAGTSCAGEGRLASSWRKRLAVSRHGLAKGREAANEFTYDSGRSDEMANRSMVTSALVRIVMLMSLTTAVGVVQSVSAASGTDASQETIRIATFNIKVFGLTKAGKAEVMSVLAGIVRKYDIVAVQEIKDRKREVPWLFLDEINDGGNDYGVLPSERTGKQEDDKDSLDQYAYYYRNSTIAVLDKSVLYEDGASDYFQREPFVARFAAKAGNFTFAMVNIHTPPVRAVEEIGALHHVVEWARERYPGEDDFIVLGDFNAGCSYASEEQLDGLEISGPDYVWIVPHSAHTNLGARPCAYDRIVMNRRGTEDYAGTWEVDRTFTEKGISDHWPVWAKFFVDRDRGR